MSGRGLERRQAASVGRCPGESPLYLGIDGGGTKTAVMLAAVDSAPVPMNSNGEPQQSASVVLRVVGEGKGGPSNLRAVGIERALESLDEGIEAAFANAGLERRPVQAACFGLAGVGREPDRKVIEDWALEQSVADQIAVMNDAETIVRGGERDWGIVVICGTGSFAFGIGPAGNAARAGGWGHLFGDEGSGYRIAIEGLRAAAQSHDGRGAHTDLLARFLKALAIERPEQLIEKLYAADIDKAAIARLADVVFESAAAGDATALKLLRHAAIDLADAVLAVRDALGLRADAAFPLAVTGGVATRQPALLDGLRAALRRRGAAADPFAIVDDAARRAAVAATRLPARS